ncbi:Polyubiquitin [Holothuria leucospilota]|uniref:Polyubiquitin n=1 Tax=Holothuria leucospilota TaxID=206669 RepID=A0A9Q1CQN5_HOLLE|nr:Polyubiquitin [Holothuria leucospilota]
MLRLSSPDYSPSLSDETQFFVENSNDEVMYIPIKAISTIENVVETQKMGSNFSTGHNSTSENGNYEKEGKLVLLSCSPLDDIEICVETFAGKILDFEINPGETIYNLKSKIQDKTGIVCEKQRLTFGGDVLQDGRIL